jgi:hypothetical protein
VTDLVGDLEEHVRQHVLGAMPDAERAGLASLRLNDLLIEYRTWRGRFIPPQPRSVHWSDELRSSPGAETYREALDVLERKVEEGEDLTPHLSGLVHRPFDNVAAPALEHRTDRDALLADWGIHHLHLSSRLKKGVAARGDDVLLAIFTERDAFFVGIRPHPKHANWAAEEIFAIVVANWPEDGLVHELRGVVGLSQQYSDDDRRALRNAGINMMMEIDGKVFAPGPLGQTIAGTPLGVTRAVQALMWELGAWRKDFDGCLAQVPDALPDAKWRPGIHAPRPGFEEYCGFISGTTFLVLGRIC